MVGTYADLALLADTVNAAAQRMLESGELSLDQLDRSSDVCAPLLQAVVNDVISTLYTQKVSGVYLIFNTQDLSGIEPERYWNEPGSISAIWTRLRRRRTGMPIFY